MKNKSQLRAPVLFLIFNRLKTTKKVFNAIKKVKPKKLFIAADGPRNKKEKKKTDKVRGYVQENIDWDCEVKKLFREENLGCKEQTISAINWFFDNVKKGIILEDDALPSQDLFWFHQELLEKYKDENRIKAICGANFFEEWDTKNSYVFSRIFFSSWGFATWRRAWRINEEEIRQAVRGKDSRLYPYLINRIIRRKKLKDALKGKTQGWDYLFSAQNALRNGLTIAPKKNLVRSMGFEEGATHEVESTDKEYLEIERKNIDFPLTHPKKTEANKKFDMYVNLFSVKKIFKKILYKLF